MIYCNLLRVSEYLKTDFIWNRF